MAFVFAMLVGQASGGDPLAFVTEVGGEATIRRVGGEQESARIGGQLSAGDELRVTEGMAVLIYLSGRSVKVGAGESHSVQQESGKTSPLIGRIKNTFDEIVGPREEAERPVVHGMARDVVDLTGALPANSRISSADFAFVWDPLEDVEEYEFTLESAAGEVLAKRTVSGTRLEAGSLSLESGKRYVWKVQEAESFLPRSSGKSWVLIASGEKATELRDLLKQIDEVYSGETRLLLKVAALFQGEFYFEAERLLIELQDQRPLSETEQQVLSRAYERMERWDRLLQPDEEEQAPVEE